MTLVPSEYVVRELIKPLSLSFPTYIGPTPGIEDSHLSVIDTFNESNPKWLRDTYRVQIFSSFQPDEYKVGYETMLQIRDAILGLPERQETDIDWIRFVLQNGPSFVGVDDRGKLKFSMNFEITAEPKSGDNRKPL